MLTPATHPRGYFVQKRDGTFCVLVCGCAEDDAGGTDGEKGAISNDAALTTLDFYIVDKGAGVGVVVGEREAELSMLVAADIDGAMVEVDAGVNGLEGSVDGVALLVAANDVVAHLQGYLLLVVEDVFDDDDGSPSPLRSPLQTSPRRGGFFGGYSDAELLATLVALEDQGLAFGVSGIIEDDVIIAFGTTYAFQCYLLLSL